MVQLDIVYFLFPDSLVEFKVKIENEIVPCKLEIAIYGSCNCFDESIA